MRGFNKKQIFIYAKDFCFVINLHQSYLTNQEQKHQERQDWARKVCFLELSDFNDKL